MLIRRDKNLHRKMIRRHDHSQRTDVWSKYRPKIFGLIKNKKYEVNAKVNKYFASVKV